MNGATGAGAAGEEAKRRLASDDMGDHAELAGAPTADEATCAVCGWPIRADDVVCPHCGAPLVAG